MNENSIVAIDNVEKVVADLLLYIEKETDIQFEYDTIGGTIETISIEISSPDSPSRICPVEVYTLDSYNYAICFVIYLYEHDGRKRIFEIALLSFNRDPDKKFRNAIAKLMEILPDIPITNHLRKSVKAEY